MVAEEEKLSKVGPSSDRFDRGRGKAVRSSIKFGQLWSGKRKSCQENLGIVTGLKGNQEKLSRKPRNHDRFEGKPGKAVKKTPES
ncbi:hypothetical protein SAMD00020551_2524 [Mesobacillus selenatarsenatis SF-1]|uniref:Uncharacterized protein n=1 Tax=Mesobacillus selenatarsenatis (strain DSM 18680 / JCM 14380 / FERM P-15431 / SF-1) TaxID=1321606 RepID=A0A0A8X329_MESS1|nr:hypothetical protein SAMD00020551_2524 [Mesobacillus selenatarsenatis SF-1]